MISNVAGAWIGQAEIEADVSPWDASVVGDLDPLAAVLSLTVTASCKAGALRGIEVDVGVNARVAIALADGMVAGAGGVEHQRRAGVELALEHAQGGARGVEQAEV